LPSSNSQEDPLPGKDSGETRRKGEKRRGRPPSGEGKGGPVEQKTGTRPVSECGLVFSKKGGKKGERC